MGYLLMGLKSKEKLIKPLQDVLDLLHQVVKLLSKIAPFAMFLMVADFFNNNSLTALYSVSIYLLAFVLYTATLFLFVTPLILKSLTQVSCRCFYKHAKQALIIAFIIRSPLVAFPMMVIGLRGMLDERGAASI